ncbi:amino acid/amide ABC transporter ATP-binding protein 2, HAAT family [Salinihabitans flavidus]|uniref:Amino acid/amide ABC transporter ATP-binding protein 2, HAAT family n=1 Tax=Salinihabitans flavidus TaxID=569882 RepID=A0A1H8RL40_9RHOB|nr:ATP-binding cassette domain-containing protein [Salinihabitans flavidus]SEO67105.1 amino acid/amide ABC transporter ATP-binding protein 2, HAAT family [Salinihabitans flavidus]
MTEPLLNVSGLDAWYGGSHILHSVALNVDEGESIALLGRNGAGKSTLLKALLDAGPRSSGLIEFGGQSLTGMSTENRARAGLMLVPEDRRIYPDITVTENIALGRIAARGRGASVSMEDIWQSFPLLEPLKDRGGGQLSGGQQQLVAVARGVFGCARLLCLDEPVEGLAPVVVDEMARDIARLRKMGLSLLIAEQNLAFVRACTERVFLIDSGVIVFSGNWQDFDADPTLKDRYLAV